MNNKPLNIYIAEPIDQKVSRNATGELAGRVLTNRGHNAYVPATAFRVGGGEPTGWIADINKGALSSADGLIAFLSAKEASVGVPAEIQFALDNGIPTVLVTDLEPTSYHVAGWKRSDGFRAVASTDPALVGVDVALGWLLPAAEEAREVAERQTREVLQRLQEDGPDLIMLGGGVARELADRRERRAPAESGLGHQRRSSHAPQRPGGFVFEAKSENAKLPERAYGTDAGFDLFTSKRTVLEPGKSTYVPTGVAADIPDGYWGMITARSSTKFRLGLDVTVGVIDEGYSGELFASVFNPHSEPVVIEEGDRLVQLIFVPTAGSGEATWGRVRTKPRGSNGFGSSGQGKMHENGAVDAPRA